jgi:hypothetical protein
MSSVYGHTGRDEDFYVKGPVTADTAKDLVEELRKACPAASDYLHMLTLAHELLRVLQPNELLDMIPAGDDPRVGLFVQRLMKYRVLARRL